LPLPGSGAGAAVLARPVRAAFIGTSRRGVKADADFAVTGDAVAAYNLVQSAPA